MTNGFHNDMKFMSNQRCNSSCKIDNINLVCYDLLLIIISFDGQ